MGSKQTISNSTINNLTRVFYWKSNEDAWNFSEKEEWTKYDENIQKFLNENYKAYLTKKNQTSTIKLISPLNSYQINFEYELQIHMVTKKTRPIRIEIAGETAIENKPPTSFETKIIKSKKQKPSEKKPTFIAEAASKIDSFSHEPKQDFPERMMKGFQDLLFFFSNKSVESDAERCYLSIRNLQINENVLFFERIQDLKARLNQKNKTVLITSSTDYQISIHKELLTNQSVSAIFIFQDKETVLDVELKSNPKIKRITLSFDDISTSLSDWIASQKMKSFRESVEKKAAHHFNCKEACIKYFCNQVIFNLFKSNKLSEHQSKEAFVSYCEENYIEYEGIDEEFLELIQCVDDNNFTSEQAIYWYTRDSFFYKLLNGVLRKDNICDFFKIRYAINQLTNSLTQYQYQSETDFYVYRASLINKTELPLFYENQTGNMNIIQLIGFISTTLDQQIAITTFGETCRFYQRENEYVILYKIKVDKKTSNKVFDIAPVAEIKDEKELMLSYDTFIKLNSVEKSEFKNFDYIVNCSISEFKEIQEKVDYRTQEITKHFDLNKIEYPLDDFYLAHLLLLIRKDEDLLKLLNQIKINDQLQDSILNNYLGCVYNYQGKYAEAIEYYNQALEISIASLGKNHPDTAMTLIYLGSVYNYQGKYAEAIEYYNQALEISIASLGKNHPTTAIILINIGSVYNNQGKYAEAIEYYNQALEIRIASLGKNHPSTATIYNNIGLVYDNQGKYAEAIEYYN